MGGTLSSFFVEIADQIGVWGVQLFCRDDEDHPLVPDILPITLPRTLANTEGAPVSPDSHFWIESTNFAGRGPGLVVGCFCLGDSGDWTRLV